MLWFLCSLPHPLFFIQMGTVLFPTNDEIENTFAPLHFYYRIHTYIPLPTAFHFDQFNIYKTYIFSEVNFLVVLTFWQGG